MNTMDFRSDTVTKPTAEMLKFMQKAPVGDDVYGEDPTVNELQEKVAAYFGKEAGLFCPSGTMTNQIAINVHTQPGDEVICHADAHVFNYEGGGIARNSGCSTKLIYNKRPVITPGLLSDAINPEADWLARTSLVVAEDTSNRGGGICYRLEELSDLSSFCRKQNLVLHLDGARAFNAIVQQRHDPKTYGAFFESISICFSKGLGAPVGSVLLGSKDFIKEARRVRKVMGGGMRQAGYLAAACIYALDNNVNRLSEDHSKAKILAQALSNCEKIQDVIQPETNILIFVLKDYLERDNVISAFKERGLLAGDFGKGRIRLVTHLDISEEDVQEACEIFKEVL